MSRIINTIEREISVVDKSLKATAMVKFRIDICEVGPLRKVCFKTTIPKWMREEIYRMNGNRNGHATIIASSLDHIVAVLDMHSSAIIQENYTPENLGKKVLFVSFSASSSQRRYYLNHGNLGKESTISFSWFIGWHWKGDVDTFFDGKKEKEIFWSLQCKTEYHPKGNVLDSEYCQLVRDSKEQQKFKEKWAIIPHTPEREEFLSSFESRLIELIAALNGFLGGISAESIDQLIADQKPLLPPHE